MTFYVQKQLALGPIRFGVSPRRALSAIDDDPSLSTGGAGEFIRHHSDGFFFGDTARGVVPVAPVAKSISSTPFLSSLKPDGTRRGYGLLALMTGGALFFLLGLAVLLRKGGAGWVEIILGMAMIATPLVMTAQSRKLIREQEERDRVEREATEARNRKMLADYVAALDRVQHDRSEDAFRALEQERTALTLPAEIWSPAARQVALRIGLDELGRRGVARAAEVARIMDRASAAAGLSNDEATGVKADLYRIVAWHLLADDRLGDVQEAQLIALRNGLGIPDRDVPAEASAIEEFERLRDLDQKSLRKLDCGLPLAFRETCVHQTATPDGPLFVTSRRLVIGAKKPVEIELPKLDEITVDVDDSAVVIRAEGQKKPLRVRVSDPIHTAAVLDLASGIEAKPKGFA